MTRILFAACMLIWIQAGHAGTTEQAPTEATRLSLEDAVQLVQARTDGRILSADRVRGSRADIYRIKVLMNDGRVKVLEVDSNPDNPDDAAEPVTNKARSKEKD